MEYPVQLTIEATEKAAVEATEEAELHQKVRLIKNYILFQKTNLESGRKGCIIN